MSGLEKISEKTRVIAIYITCALMLAVMGFLSIQSLIATTIIDTEFDATMEKVFYKSDNLLINILALAVGAGVVFLFRRASALISLKRITIIMFIWFTCVGVLWIFSVFNSTFADSLIVKRVADSFAAGEYELSGNNALYVRKFPFQLGLAAYIQLLTKLFWLKTEISTMFFQVLNVLWFALAMFMLVKIVNLAVNERTAKLTAILCMCAIQPVFFCVFVYGNIPAFALGTMAVYYMLVFMRDYKLQHALVSAVCIGVSVCLKKNSYIILVAMLITLCFDLFRNRVQLIKKVAYAVLCVVLSVGILSGITNFYAKRMNVNLNEGIPLACWLAMGLGESELESGWFNSEYTEKLYRNNDRDAEKTAAAAAQVIKQELDGFKSDLPGAASFFYRKIVSQWNEPTYQSLWMSKITNDSLRWGLGTFFTGEGEKYVNAYMNFYQQLIFAAAFIGIFFCLRKRNYCLNVLALIVLGGFLYHLLFEAKAQYSLIYFMLLLPFAANGFEVLLSLTDKKPPSLSAKAEENPEDREAVLPV